MRIVFVIGGMGAGKSTAGRALEDLGLARLDFDQIGHEVLAANAAKDALAQEFGAAILDSKGQVDRAALAQRAFASEEATARLDAIMMPCIEEAFRDRVADLEEQNVPAAVAEASVFKRRDSWLIRPQDLVIAITAPLEARVARAVSAGWAEDDVRRRIARQVGDDVRCAAADAVFENNGTAAQLRAAVADWWNAVGCAQA